MSSQVVQTFEECGLRIDVYSDGDAILNHEAGFLQLSADLLARMANASGPRNRTKQTVEPTEQKKPEHPKLVRPLVDNPQYPGAWLADFKLPSGDIATFIYKSRTSAREGEATDEVGQRGRLL